MIERADFRINLADVDAFGIVNQASYYSYLDQAREQFFKMVLDVDFSDKENVHKSFLLEHIALNFKKSLSLNEAFYILTELSFCQEKVLEMKQRLFNLQGELLIDANIKGHCFKVIDDQIIPFLPNRLKETMFLNVTA